MTEIRPVSTDDDYKIACYFHDKLTELYSHWKIKFHIYCSHCGAKFRLPVIPRELTINHKTELQIGDSSEMIETPFIVNTLELIYGDKFC